MKTLKITGLFMIGLVALSSCKKNKGIRGNGNIQTETRTVSDFDKIELSGVADVSISQGTTFSVEVETDENILPYVETKVQGSELEIGLKNNTHIKGNSTINVYITMPELVKAEISGSGNMHSNDAFYTNSFTADISGSGDLDFGYMNANELVIDISGSGDAVIGSTDTVNNQKIRVSGSGNINLLSMPTLKSDINISGSGNAKINVIEEIDARISGSGDIRYMGNPAVTSNISGSGTIAHY